MFFESAIRRVFSLVKKYGGLEAPLLCESLALWAPSRPSAWNMKLIYPSFSFLPRVPENLMEDSPAVAARYLANTELGFSGQFLFCLPNARVRGPHGFVVLEEGEGAMRKL